MKKSRDWLWWLKRGWIPRWVTRLLGLPSPSEDLLTPPVGEVAYDETIVQARFTYRFRATYLDEPKGESLIEVWRDGEPVKAFRWPSYKIWNILAHAGEIIVGLEQDSDAGLYVAGSDLLGGNVYQPEATND
jgi:hypothetical protein